MAFPTWLAFTTFSSTHTKLAPLTVLMTIALATVSVTFLLVLFITSLLFIFFFSGIILLLNDTTPTFFDALLYHTDKALLLLLSLRILAPFLPPFCRLCSQIIMGAKLLDATARKQVCELFSF